jgi:hypothetical protein
VGAGKRNYRILETELGDKRTCNQCFSKHELKVAAVERGV